jgi:alkylation response protein AidB-like acyl-CoA dehydrogenase
LHVIALGIQLNLFGASIYRLGNESHRRNYMKEIEKYNVIGGFCLTEVGTYLSPMHRTWLLVK